MKAAVVALACLLRLAVTAQADGIARSALAASSPPATVPVAAAVPVAAPIPAKPGEPAAAPKAVPPRDAAMARADDARRDGWRSRVCFNAAQTRENIVTHRLAEPFRALRVGGQQGEALRAKLCKWKQDEWIYVISVLRRDGRIVRLYMNAQNGQAVGALDDQDRR